ncbi:MAG: cytochrome c oxidase accessory protein CcoG [Melioribacteraceae bacterium]|nr:cytochrome c oxidase accessory protein CcoG [Melioribacteraceae bacterium]
MSEENKHKMNQSFRDSIATVTQKGDRIWIYPKKPRGKFYNARILFSSVLLLLLYGLPFVKVNGNPLILLNILDRKIILFGAPFGPHDFHLFVIAMILIIISIFLFTVVYGRIFCGWLCPQTVFMEMVYRKIEYLIEGDAYKQRALSKMKWNGEKIFKKSFKHGIFFAIAFVTSNIFLSYIIGIDELSKIIQAPVSEHLTGFTAILIFSTVFYYVFAFFREQACLMVCPYGRLQGVMLDEDSVVISYDHVRGEPRGVSKKENSTLGDCVDCNQCVQVCPTGIDIRNGTQLECVNCTACIDACDEVMDKVDKPRGLIRYASLNEIEKGVRSLLTSRSIGYTVVLIILFGILTILMSVRGNFELSIFRTPGMMYQQYDSLHVSNLYDFVLINKTFDTIPARLELDGIDGEIKVIGSNLIAEPHGTIEAKFLVIIKDSDIKELNTPISIVVKTNGKNIDEIKTSFLGRIEKFRKKKK